MKTHTINSALQWFGGSILLTAFVVIFAGAVLSNCAWITTTEHKIAAAWIAQEQAAKLITTLTTAKTDAGAPLVTKADLQKAQDCLNASSALLSKAERFYRNGVGEAAEAKDGLKIAAKSIDVILDVLSGATKGGKFDFSCKALAEVT